MADAAAAAAAYSAQGPADEPDSLFEKARRAELAKRAQQASDAVLRSHPAVAQESNSRYDMHR